MGEKVVIEALFDVTQSLGNSEKLAKSFEQLSKSVNADANGALKTFGVNLNALDNPLTAVAQGLKASIDYTIQYAGEIDKLSRNTGMSAQEASKLATVFNDVGVSTSTLESALKAMTKQGLTPNMETFKKLAAQYQAIEDPVKRNEFAFKNFGRAALDMTEVLTKTPAQLDELAAAAQRSGKVIGQDMVDNAEQLEIQMAQLNDMVDGLKIAVGGPLVDTLSKAATGFVNLKNTVEILKVKMDENSGSISHAEAVMRATQIAGGDLEAVARSLGGEYGTLDESTRAATLAQDALNASQMAAKTDATDPLIGATDALSLSTQKLTNSLIYQQASKALDPAAALELGRSLGVVDDKTVMATNKINTLAADLAAGKITVEQYQNAIHNLAGDLDALPASKTININVVQNGDVGQVIQTTGGRQTRRASGGPVTTGMPYWVGEQGPELFFPGQSGQIVDAQKSSQLVNNTRSVVMNVTNVGGMNSENTARLKALAAVM